MKNFDIIIIGGGGGTKLRPAADLGYKTAIIEKESFGGTCLNRGCIPSKMFIYPSDLVTHYKEDIAKYHITADTNFEINFEKLTQDINTEIKADSDSIAPAYEKNPNITVYQDHARFVDDKIIEVGGEKITADRIYIATGSRPQIPPIEGLEGTPYMTSRELLQNESLPESMIVIGGGYIAVELGHVYGALGCEVDFIVRSGMVSGEDEDIINIFEQNFSSRYKVHLKTSTQSVSYSEDQGFEVLTTDEEGNEKIFKAEALLIATGVVPNSDDLGLENTNITKTKRGYIEVDDCLQTAVPGVFALGDVVGNYLFRHSVNFEGEYLFDQHFGEGKFGCDKGKKTENKTEASFTATNSESQEKREEYVFTKEDMIKLAKEEQENEEVRSISQETLSKLVKSDQLEASRITGEKRTSEYAFEDNFSENEEMRSFSPILYPPMPHAIFSYPQVAGVGMREQDLKKNGLQEGVDYVSHIHQYKNSAMGMAMKPEVGAVKFLADTKTRKLLGVHIIGEKASDIIHSSIAYMTMGATVDQMLEMIYIHPALSEVVKNGLRMVVKKLS